eukprot:scaffold28754_cov58-Phaeocystis_antarctica.AAC.1
MAVYFECYGCAHLGRRSEESGHVARDVSAVTAQRQHLVSVRVRVRVSLRSTGPAAAPAAIVSGSATERLPRLPGLRGSGGSRDSLGSKALKL